MISLDLSFTSWIEKAELLMPQSMGCITFLRHETFFSPALFVATQILLEVSINKSLTILPTLMVSNNFIPLTPGETKTSVWLNASHQLSPDTAIAVIFLLFTSLT